MELIDTHTHLYLPEFDDDREEMIARSVSSGVVKLLMPNIDIHSVKPMLSAADRFKGICFPMIGLHPTSVKDDYKEQIEELEKTAGTHKFIGVGEIGIDLYWDKSRQDEQRDAMKKQVAFAVRSALPVVIHSRNSFNEVVSVLEEFRGEDIKGVFHAFSGNAVDAEKAVAMGFMIGIGGPLTYKNSKLPEAVRAVGRDYILTETDAPYLPPVPHRGERNESSYIRIINKKLAELFMIDEEAMASLTFKNACRLFKI